MPPIPIYTSSPINASKASGVTPQTAPAGSDEQGSAPPPPPQADPTTHQPTKTVPSAHAYPRAQPGAVPSMPEPTGGVPGGIYAPQQIPPGPAPTGTLGGGQSPPAPQPGAVPVPPGGHIGPKAPPPTSLPPPPRAGEVFQPPEPTARPQLPGHAPGQASSFYYPPQMSIPAPTLPYQPHGTSTSTSPSGNSNVNTHASSLAGTTASLVSNDLEHPPGYRQNSKASASSGHNDAYHQQGSAASGEDGEPEGVLGTAKKLAQAAGQKLSSVETEVWKRINSRG